MVNKISSWLKNLSDHPVTTPKNAVRPGFHHYLREEDHGKTRIHLRNEADGSVLLLINAARVLHLNTSAGLMARLYLDGVPPESSIKQITQKFKVDKQQATHDYSEFCAKFSELISPDGGCPICDLELDIIAPFSKVPAAPYRMDLAITYRCNNDCSHCYNDRPRNYPELTTDKWIKVIDLLYQIGIPHVVFTGGEPTLRSDLPELIAYAEKKGLITGINTNGRKLKDPVYVDQLVRAGLDHAQITLESHIPEVHNVMVANPQAWDDTISGIRNVLATHLYVMTNTTLLSTNAPYLENTLDYLAELGVPTIGLNALIYSGKGLTVDSGLHESELPALLQLAREKTENNGQKLIWYTPTQYCNFDPVQMELGVKGCTAASYNMCVEPDGSVLPCQSYYHSLGNLLSDPWDSIWNHELAISLREHKNLPEKCYDCLLVNECGGGCPLTHQLELTSDRHSTKL